MSSVCGSLIATAIFPLRYIGCDQGFAERADSSHRPFRVVADSSSGIGISVAPSSGFTGRRVPERMPPGIDSIGAHGGDLYDEIKLRGWARGANLVAALHTDLSMLPEAVTQAAADRPFKLDPLQNVSVNR